MESKDAGLRELEEKYPFFSDHYNKSVDNRLENIFQTMEEIANVVDKGMCALL